jgi:uncharacterized damage-inducible protein DinB
VKYDEIPRTASERTTLIAFLEWQRDALRRRCEGLDDDALRTRSAPPSTLSLLGIVRHMADVERGWFRRTIAGEDIGDRFSSGDDEDGDFNNLESCSTGDAFAAWGEECEAARHIVDRLQLDAVGTQRTGRQVALRWVLVHMIEEYSRHNGHADLLRERIDGATGYV